MENQNRRWQTMPEISRSPRLVRAKSARTPDKPPLESSTGRKSVDRPNSTRRSSISSSKAGEENRNPSAAKIIIPGIIKKHQDENPVISSPAREFQRYRSPEVVKTIQKSIKKPQDENLIINSPAREFQRHRSPEVVKTIQKLIKEPQDENLIINSPAREFQRHRSPDVVKTIQKSIKKPQDENLIINSPAREFQRHRSPEVVKTIQKLIKEPQDENLIINSPAREFQRHRSPDVVKTIQKLKTKKTEPVSPSAWALSPGRSPSTFPLPESPNSSGRTEKQRSRSVNSVLNYFKHKKSSSIQEEAFHQLRIMHTKLLQWRFANARAECTLAANKDFAEEKIFKVWLRIFHLRNSIIEKQVQIRKLKHEDKIMRIINSQVCILEEWEKIDKKNSEAVVRIGKKLSASTTGVPLTNGAKADTGSVQSAINAAMGVTDSIEATIMKFISRVEETGSLASELVNTVEQERKSLEELRKEIAIVASLEEQQKSLRAQVIQAAKERRVEGNHLLSSIKLMDVSYTKDKEKPIHEQRYRKGHFLRLYLSNIQNKDNLGQEI